MRDRLSFQLFLGLSPEDTVPDAKTLWLFREQLVRHGLIDKLFVRFDEQLCQSGLIGLAGNHPFTDGNKRIALTVAAVFLELNGHSLDAPEPEAVIIYQQLASGSLTEEELSLWIERSSASIA